METALYYTLSTIAQTLAGALAILVAVVLFKLAALKQVIEESKAEFARRNVDPTPQVLAILRNQGAPHFLAHVEQVLRFTGVGPTSQVGRAAQAASAAYQEWSRINTRLYVTLGATVTNIGVCFGALPFTRRIACSSLATWLMFLVAVGLGLACLALYIWLIAAMVRRPTD